ncbi:T9SS type A sorting domain-containing protein [Flavobacterium beibuense]|uniref:T9SS type A sorting domain-containing protein n=1 Tax=Flavobacterium beibuense TaxID=657326 RepID=UPI003A8E2E54
MKKIYFLFMLLVGLSATAQDGWVYTAFNPTLSTASNYRIAKDYATDDLYVAYNAGGGTYSIKRINASTGAVVGSFTIPANFTSPPSTMLVQSDGKLVVYGSFISYNGDSTYKRIIRFNTNGSIDTTFNQSGSTFQSNIFTCKTMVENGSKLVLGGTSNSGNILYQINKSNGSMDTTFNSNASSITELTGNPSINAIKVYGGNIIIGGHFNVYGTGGFPTPGTICKLNSSGTLVSGFFLNGYGGTVTDLDVQQSTGKIVFCGTNAITNATTVVQLNSNGNVDTTFTSPSITGSSSFINPTAGTIQIQQNTGKVLFAGEFTTVNGVSRNDIARVTTTGAIDLTFDPGAGSNVNVIEILLDSSNNLYVRGPFTSFGPYTRSQLVKISTSVMGRPALGVDVPEISNSKISVFPNPSQGIFNLQMDGYEGETFELTVYNTLGQTIIEKTLTGENNYQIDLTGQNTGNYFVKLANNNTVINKIIVKK